MLNNLLEKVTKQLEESKIPYMVSGSLAMITYTTPRMTRDIDIIINIQSSDLSVFLEIFKEGYYINANTVEFEIKTRGMFNVIDFESGFKIDFIVRKNTAFHINEFNRKILSDAYGFPVWIVSKEDLVISKLNWIQELQSDTQIQDIKNLLANPTLDIIYINNWCKELGLNKFKLF
jgi:hypothetical protein